MDVLLDITLVAFKIFLLSFRAFSNFSSIESNAVLFYLSWMDEASKTPGRNHGGRLVCSNFDYSPFNNNSFSGSQKGCK